MLTTTSSITGSYLFTGLLPGVYLVDVPATLPGLQRTTAAPKVVNLTLAQNYLDADFGYIVPTAVNLASFAAQAKAQGVMVRWTTSYEQGQEGFQVWRSTSADGQYKPVSPVIGAMNSETGASYEWLDATATGGAYWYKLQSLPDGQFFGPVSSVPEPGGGSSRVFMPVISR